MDKIDKKILLELQADASIHNNELADRVGLAPSSCHRRVKILYRAGLITKTIALTDPTKMGRALRAIINVILVDHSIEKRRHWLNLLESEPAISQAYTVTGGADAVFVLNLKDMVEYQSISERLFSTDQNVVSYSTFFVLQEHKFDLTIHPEIVDTRE